MELNSYDYDCLQSKITPPKKNISADSVGRYILVSSGFKKFHCLVFSFKIFINE